MRSKILLQHVEILATERVLNLAVGNEAPVQRVTLLVTPAQAEKLAVVTDATKKSIIRFLSRHPEDQKRTVTDGVQLIDLLMEEREYLKVELFKDGKNTYRTFYR